MKGLKTLEVVSIRPGDGTYIADSIDEEMFTPLLFSFLLSNPDKNSLQSLESVLNVMSYHLL